MSELTEKKKNDELTWPLICINVSLFYAPENYPTLRLLRPRVYTPYTIATGLPNRVQAPREHPPIPRHDYYLTMSSLLLSTQGLEFPILNCPPL